MDLRVRNWLEADANRFPTVRRSLRIAHLSLAIIEAARAEVGAPVLPPAILRGRPARLNYADLSACSRDRYPREELSRENHKAKHKDVHVHGCSACYARHYSYIRNHPEHERPKDWWRDGDPRTATLDGKPRRWVDRGWETHNPLPEPGTLDRLLEEIRKPTRIDPEPPPPPETAKDIEKRNLREWRAYQARGGKPLRLMQGTWPLTDDEDPE